MTRNALKMDVIIGTFLELEIVMAYIDSIQAFGVNAVVFSLCIIPLIINEAIIIFFVWYRRLKNKKIERKEIFEEKYSTKGLTIIGILIVVLILLIFILIGIHDYLNKQPLP